MKRLLSLFYSLLFIAYSLLAATPQELFEQANAAYTKGQYQQAIQQYESILSTGNQSKELHYNLGNAYFKTKQKGKAVLHFERALLLAPADEDVAFNLAVVEQQLEDDLDVVGTFFLKKWWQGFYRSLSANMWSVLTLLSLWLGVGGLIVWLLSKERQRRKQGFGVGLFLLALGSLFLLAARSQAQFETNSQQAILLDKTIAVRNGPDEQSTTLLTIHEGLKVELLDEIGEWYKVKLSNGEQGWLPKSAVEEI